MKLPEPTFYPLPELARLWGCGPEIVSVYATVGTLRGDRLRVGVFDLNGKQVEGVTPEEKYRFERIRSKPFAEDDQDGKERTSMLGLIGALSVLWCGGDPTRENRPFVLVNEINEAAENQKVPMIRQKETNAKLIREALLLLGKHGYKRGGA